jgi:hypothetical protein
MKYSGGAFDLRESRQLAIDLRVPLSRYHSSANVLDCEYRFGRCLTILSSKCVEATYDLYNEQ